MWSRWARCVFVVLSALAAGGGVSTAHAGVFAFVDDDGGVHLSNVPDDPRYQVLLPESGPGDRAADAAAPGAPAGRGARPLPFDAIVQAEAARHGLDQLLLHAVIRAESGHDAAAVSRKGAVGLMQIMPDTARRYGVTDRFDPGQNVAAGARHLRALLRQFGNDLPLALAAYNAGENAVIRHGWQIPPFKETRGYVPRVLDLYRRYRAAS